MPHDILHILDDVVGGGTGGGALGGTSGPFFAYVERLRDRRRWLATVVLGVDGTFPPGPLAVNFVDLDDDGQAEVSVQVRVSMVSNLSSPTIDRVEVSFRRLRPGRVVDGYRLYLRADGEAVFDADTSADLSEVPFVFLGFDGPANRVDVPDRLDLVVVPRGLDSDTPSTWVPRACATGTWSRDAAEADGQQFDISLRVVQGTAPTSFQAGLVTGGQPHPGSHGPLRVASPTQSPYLAAPAPVGDAVVARPDSAGATLVRVELQVKAAGVTAGTTTLDLDLCLWRELVAGGAPGLLDTQLAATVTGSIRADLAAVVTSRDAGGTTTASVDVGDLPTQVALRLLPARRVPDPSTPGSDGQDAWLGYVANEVLGHVQVEVSPASGVPLWLRAESVPTRSGVTHAGLLEDVFVVRLGDPDDLASALAAGIGRAGLEFGPHRHGVLGDLVEVRQSAGSVSAPATWRFAVPGLDHLDVRLDAPATPGGGLLDRDLRLRYHLSGAPQPLAAEVHLDAVAGFAGTATAAGLPHALELRHTVPAPGGHELRLDLGEVRLGGLDALLQRPAPGPADPLPYGRIEAHVRWLASFQATWSQDTAGLVAARLGALVDPAAGIPGGLGQLAVALDRTPAASPLLALVPELRFELIALPGDPRLLVGAAGLARARFERQASGLQVEVVRADPAFREATGPPVVMTHMPTDRSVRRRDYSLAVLHHAAPTDRSAPRRTVVHVGHLHDRLQATLTFADGSFSVATEGRLERLKAVHLEQPRGSGPQWDADTLRAEVSMLRVPARLDVTVGKVITVDPSEAVTVLTSVRDPGGIGHVNATLALPAGESRVDTSVQHTTAVSAGTGPGATGRVGLSEQVDGLVAVRAAPQVFVHSDTITTETGEVDGTTALRAMTARVYGLRRLLLVSTPVERPGSGMLTKTANTSIELDLDPSRPNTALRVATVGADLPGRPVRPLSRMRLSAVSPLLRITSTSGDELWQTASLIESLSGPIAAEGDTWAEPPQIPWDGPAAGTLVGVGLTEARLEQLPTRLRQVTLPFDAVADTAGVAGMLSASGFFGGGTVIEVVGSMRIARLLQLGWGRSRGGQDKWSRTDAECIRVSSDSGGRLWLRQLEKRGAPFDEAGQLNIVVDAGTIATLAVDAYEAIVTRGTSPLHWSKVNGRWKPSAKIALKGFSGWVQVTGTPWNPTDESVRSGNWWLRAVGAFAVLFGRSDVSFGNTSGTGFDKNPIDDVCGG